jgi:hypothetical protein
VAFITKISHGETQSGQVFASYEIDWTTIVSYTAGGEVFDISAEFSGSPTVVCSGGAATTTGYVIDHDGGTAAAGKLIVKWAGAAGAALPQITAGTNLTNVRSKAIAFGERP